MITQSTANINFNDKINSPEVLLANADDITACRIVPELTWGADCSDNIENDNDIFVKGNQKQSDINYEDGTVFSIKLVTSVVSHVGTEQANNVTNMYVNMPEDLGFKVDGLIRNAQDEFEVDPEFATITNHFGLQVPNKEMIEIIPVSTGGTTIVEKYLRISATKIGGGDLPTTHWAYKYTDSQNQIQIVCDSSSCCIDEYEQFIPQNADSNIKTIDSIFGTDGDSALLNNASDATFYSKKIDAPSWSGSKSSTGNAMAISWSKCRENTSFCYPPTNEGTKASFMTIYADEARLINNSETHEKLDNESQHYDPRYAIMEIGAQDALNGKLVRLTVNSGSKTGENERCYKFKFNGSEQGTHFTLQELKLLDASFEEREITPDGG